MNRNGFHAMIMQNFNRRLTLALDKTGFSQSFLSRMIDCSQAQISHYLKGTSFPKPIILQQLSYHLNVNYQWLNTGYGNKEVSDPYPLELFHENFSDRLTWLIWSNNKNKSDVEEYIDYPVNQYILGAWRPNTERMELLANYLGSSVEWLAPNDNDMPSIYDWKRRFLLKSQQEYYAMRNLILSCDYGVIFKNRVKYIKQYLHDNTINILESIIMSEALVNLEMVIQGRGNLSIEEKHAVYKFLDIYFDNNNSIWKNPLI